MQMPDNETDENGWPYRKFDDGDKVVAVATDDVGTIHHADLFYDDGAEWYYFMDTGKGAPVCYEEDELTLA